LFNALHFSTTKDCINNIIGYNKDLMSFFLEKEQFNESVDTHLQHVYEHLFPHCRWDALPRVGIQGILFFIPPIMANSEAIGYEFKYNLWRSGYPFIYRDDIKQSTDKLAMKFLLTDVMLSASPIVDPMKTSRFDPFMNEGDRFGGIAEATIGILKLPFWPIPDPPGRSEFNLKKIWIMGIENNNTASAVLYFE
jgi:hypothetical protein